MKTNSKVIKSRVVTTDDRRRWKIAYRKNNPWVKNKDAIRIRCSNKKQDYASRGIKDLISVADLKFLWFRDKAHDMKKPSIDRIDSTGNYTLENCRYMELSENISNGNRERWAKWRKSRELK